MEKNRNAYRIGEVSEYFGVSRDTLRLYDRMGILSPGKNPENQYRMYTREEVLALDFIINLRKTGLPLSEIRSAAGSSSAEELRTMLQTQAEVLAARKRELQELQVMVDDYLLGLDSLLESMGKIALETSPVLILRRAEGSMIQAMDAFKQLSRSRIPRFTFLVPRTLFDRDSGWPEDGGTDTALFSRAITLVDDEDLASRPDFPSDRFQIFGPVLCVHAAMATDLSRDSSGLQRCRSFIRERNLTLAGDPLIRIFAVRTGAEAYCDFWLPVESGARNI